MTASQVLPQAFQATAPSSARGSASRDGSAPADAETFHGLLSELSGTAERGSERAAGSDGGQGPMGEEPSLPAPGRKTSSEADSTAGGAANAFGWADLALAVQALFGNSAAAGVVAEKATAVSGPDATRPVSAAGTPALTGDNSAPGFVATLGVAAQGGDGAADRGLLLPGAVSAHPAESVGVAFAEGAQVSAGAETDSARSLARDGAAVETFFVQVSVQRQETHFAPVLSGARVLGPASNGLASAPPGSHGATASGADTADSEGETKLAGATTDAGSLRAVVTASLAADGGSSGTAFGGGDGLAEESAGTTPEARSGEQRPVRIAGELAVSAQGSATSVEGETISQIARRVVEELSSGWSRASASLPSSPGASVSGPAGGVLKVLHLKLEPADLGSVTVRLGLKDDVISLHIEASNRDTARVIEKERESLASALKSAGYLVDGITAQAADGMRSGLQVQQTLQADARPTFSSAPQSGMEQSAGQGGSASSRHPQNTGSGGGTGINEGRDAGPQRASGALYV